MPSRINPENPTQSLLSQMNRLISTFRFIKEGEETFQESIDFFDDNKFDSAVAMLSKFLEYALAKIVYNINPTHLSDRPKLDTLKDDLTSKNKCGKLTQNRVRKKFKKNINDVIKIRNDAVHVRYIKEKDREPHIKRLEYTDASSCFSYAMEIVMVLHKI